LIFPPCDNFTAESTIDRADDEEEIVPTSRAVMIKSRNPPVADGVERKADNTTALPSCEQPALSSETFAAE
jgi:hypothetical protein